MRDPKRIERIMNKISTLWGCVPEKFTEFINKYFTRDGKIIFYLEDDKFEEKLDKFIPVSVDTNNEFKSICTKYAELWSYVPDWRFMQVLSNFFTAADILQEYTNKEFEKKINFLLKRLKEKGKM